MSTSAKDYSIIGVSGMPRSGKDSLVELLVEAGYYGVSGGDIVREYAFKRHADKSDPISVKNMTETSNWLRSEYGSDVILQKALDRFEEARKIKNYKGLITYSVRAPIEVDFVLKHGGELIWVEASADIRYERDKDARRKGEIDISKEEFLRQEALQWEPQPGIDSSIQMNMKYVKEHATIIFDNNANYEAFKQNAQKLIDSLSL